MIDRKTYFTKIPRVPWTAIRFRITIGIVLILSVLFLFFAKVAITEQRTRMLQQMENYGREITRFMAQISIVPIQKFSIYQLENNVIQIEKGQLIAYCNIYDDKGLLLTPGEEASAQLEQKVGGDASPRIKTFIAAITENGVHYGQVEVGLYVDSVYSKIDRTSLYIIAAFCLGVVLIGGTVSFFIHRQLVRPIQELSKTTKTIAGGDFVTSNISKREDEIGELADSINLMSGNLEESYRTLENNVDERTAELYHAKNMAEQSSRHLQVVGEEVQALLDNSPVGIVFVTDGYNILRVNEEFSRITGYPSEEIVGKSMRMFYPDSSSFLDFSGSSKQLDRDGLFIKRTELVKNDGSVISCAVRGRKTILAGGAQGVVLNFEDITSRLLIEEELLKIKKLESVRVLARGIAHDFNNILVAILGNLSLVERLTERDTKVNHLLGEARRASLRAKDLTEKLLSFAKGSEPDAKVEHLSELLKSAAPVVLAGSSIDCHFDIEDGVWKVKMDKNQIDTVVQSIVLNAREALGEKGEITIKCSNKTLLAGEASTLKPGSYVLITITDTGAGIAPEHIDQVFDPYFSTKEKDSNKGSGLGLSIVRSILMKHKGSVSIESLPGQGCTVSVYLPAVKKSFTKAVESPQQILPSGKGVVVVADVETEMHDMAEEMLQYLGYEYIGSSSLEAAVATIEEIVGEKKKNLILLLSASLTEGMAKGRVVELFTGFSANIRLVVCHDEDDDELGEEYINAGFDMALKKPFQLLELSRALATVPK